MLSRRSLLTWACGAALAISSLQPARAAEGKDIVDTAVGAGSFNTLVAAVKAAGLVDALKSDGPFTVFAPTDDAFKKLPAGTVETLLKPENKDQLIAILKYHVVAGAVGSKDVVKIKNAETLLGQRVDVKVDGNNVMIDNAKVTAVDIACSNGVIHVIDSVILPASDNIPTTAVKAGNFKTLVAAVKAAGLAEALSGEGPFTVFAPTDAAFAKLPEGTIASLLKPENKDQLVAILKYHVVPGRVYSDQALELGKAKTLQGSPVTIAVKGGKAKLNDANLVALDIEASNGVIHVIDSVILPPKDKRVTKAAARKMIADVVSKGSHMYNTGHHSACASLYEEAARKMVSYGDEMPPIAHSSLSHALEQAARTECQTTRAWVLRGGLDQAYAAMIR